MRDSALARLRNAFFVLPLLAVGCTNPWLGPSEPSDPSPESSIEYVPLDPAPSPRGQPARLPSAPATVLPLDPKNARHAVVEHRQGSVVRYEPIRREASLVGPISEDHDELEAMDERDDGGEPAPHEPEHGDEHEGDAADLDLSGVKPSDLALEDREDRRDASGKVVVPRVPKRPEVVDPSVYGPRFTEDGIAFPYPTTKMFRGFGPCRGRRHHHEGIDLGGVGPEWGIGTPIRSMARAEVLFIGLGADNPDDFGLPDTRDGESLRGDRMLPRSKVIEPYGEVHFFTRKKGRWRSGNIIVTRAVEGPLAEHTIRYLHVAAVHPDVKVGDIVEAGQEIALMGGTGVQESAPHLHLDIAAPNGRRVDVAPLLGLAPTATCKVKDERTADDGEREPVTRTRPERSRLAAKVGDLPEGPGRDEDEQSEQSEKADKADKARGKGKRDGKAERDDEDERGDGPKGKDRDEEKAKGKDRDEAKAKGKDRDEAKGKRDEAKAKGKERDEEAEPEGRATLKLGALTVPRCKSKARVEDFGSGRYDAHGFALDLDEGQSMTIEVIRKAGTWKPKIEVVGGEVDARALASGKIGGKAVSTLRATGDGKARVVVTGWGGRPPEDGRYALKVTEKCRRR